MDLQIGISLWFAGVVVAVWAYLSNRRSRRVKKGGEIPPRRVLQAYNQAMLREKLEDEAITAGSYPRSPVDCFEMGVNLALPKEREGWCEHCGYTGKCSVCGADHGVPHV